MMKIHTLALVVPALYFAGAVAAGASPYDRAPSLADVVAQMESRYGGEVTAIQFDGSGDKPAHYHVDMRFPDSGTATVDVDAATLEIGSRDAVAAADGSATLAEAVALLAEHVPGGVTFAELDASAGGSPHYDIDVRLPRGERARLKVDAATREIAWRNPPIVAE